MRIDPSTQSAPSSVSTPNLSKSKTQFNQVLASKQAEAIVDLKKDLKQVSLDLRSGKITNEQASQQFVNLVIEKKHEFNLSQADLLKVQNAIGDQVNQNPNFVSNLQNALRKI